MKAAKSAAILAGVWIVLSAGCSGAASRPVSREAAAARVGHLLYAENLIANAEVAARVRASVTAVDRDGVPADSVLPELHAWLERWVREHPDRVERARMMPNVPPSQRPVASGSE